LCLKCHLNPNLSRDLDKSWVLEGKRLELCFKKGAGTLKLCLGSVLSIELCHDIIAEQFYSVVWKFWVFTVLVRARITSFVWYSAPHLTTSSSTAVVIVWRLRELFYIANVLPFQWAQLTETAHAARLGLEFVFFVFFFSVAWFIYMFLYVFFYLGQLESFPFMFLCWHNKPIWAPFEFLLPPHCRLGAGSIPFRAIVNNKQCEMRLFMSLVIYYRIGDVQDSQGVSASKWPLLCPVRR